MYDGKSQFLVRNPINSYLINSPMLPGMRKEADGALTLYLQRTAPVRTRKQIGFLRRLTQSIS